MALEAYRRKRDFRHTAEPEGRGRTKAAEDGRLRFVVQRHAATRLHYDFRLELDGVLKSWAVPKGPSLDPSARRLAMHVEDHPIEYGDFEGVIPEGEYGGGTVMLWDRGYWEPHGDPQRGYRRGRLKFHLDGERLRGTWNLVRMRTDEPGDRESWLLIKEADGEAVRGDNAGVLERFDESVVSGRRMEEIANDRDRVWTAEGEVESHEGPSSTAKTDSPGRSSKRVAIGIDSAVASLEGAKRCASPPTRLEAQLAQLVDEAPAGSDWLHEIKLDGYRILCRIEDGRARLISRNGNDWTERFEEIAAAAALLPVKNAVIDGEVVVLDARGISHFQSLQNALSARPGRRNLHYFAFDLLHVDGYDVRGVPLANRKKLLETLLNTGPDIDAIRYSDHVRGRGKAFYRQACEAGLEGIIAKRADAPYRAGRGSDWRKVKCLLRQEFVVVGYTDPSGARAGFGALLLGVNDSEGRLVGAGRVGTGFTDATLRDLHRRLKKLEEPKPSVSDPPRGAAARGIHWVRPELVAEVAFTEWTGDGMIRHPSFQGLREDKNPEEIVREKPSGGETAEAGAPTASTADDDGGPATTTGAGAGTGPAEIAGVRLSNPDRVLWPEQGVTKADLASYYVDIADYILPHIARRPLTLVRCPSGRHTKCFYQKHANDGVPDHIPRVKVIEDDGEAEYLEIADVRSIIALVQLGVLEFHIPGARSDRQDRPDRLVFDLDPDEDLPWTEVVAAALLLRHRLEEIGLRSFLKTTGGKGLHVVLPITRRTSWDDARAFTRGIAEEFAAQWPHRFTAVMSKKKRTDRIYMDFLRNAPNATAIAPYSTRARPGAPVATPVAWEELERSAERPWFDIDTIRARALRGEPEPWAEMEGVRQSLTRAMLREVAGMR